MQCVHANMLLIDTESDLHNATDAHTDAHSLTEYNTALITILTYLVPPDTYTYTLLQEDTFHTYGLFLQGTDKQPIGLRSISSCKYLYSHPS